MKCVICKQGATKLGHTNITLELEDMVCVIKQVPAEVCTNCGEAYLDAKTTQVVMEIAKKASQQGIRVGIRQYRAA